jgi:ABC-type sugar transport system permease subunit
MFGISVYPLAYNLVTSFYGPAAVGHAPPFVAFANYAAIVSDPTFAASVAHTLVWTAGVVVLSFGIGLGLALLLNQQFAGVNVARVLFLTPWLTPSIASAIIWRYMYNTDYGIINLGLQRVGLGALASGWITDPNVSLFAAMMVQVWRTYGFYMIMLLGGLQAVPREMIEAAVMDGARSWQRLWAVVLPQLQPVIVMVLLLDIIWASNNFDTVYVVTGGGPLRSSETVPLFVYFTAFQNARLPEASAGSVILFAIALVLIGAYLTALVRLRGREEML